MESVAIGRADESPMHGSTLGEVAREHEDAPPRGDRASRDENQCDSSWIERSTNQRIEAAATNAPTAQVP